MTQEQPLRPTFVNAVVIDGEIVITADTVPVLAFSAASALWFLSRIADALSGAMRS